MSAMIQVIAVLDLLNGPCAGQVPHNIVRFERDNSFSLHTIRYI